MLDDRMRPSTPGSVLRPHIMTASLVDESAKRKNNPSMRQQCDPRIEGFNHIVEFPGSRGAFEGKNRRLHVERVSMPM